MRRSFVYNANFRSPFVYPYFMKKQYKRHQIKIGNLFLNPNNPRHELIEGEPAIILHLIEKEGVIELAKDIAEHGLSILDGPIAVQPISDEGSGWQPTEGNRRVCALKLLADPDKTPEKLRKRIREIAKQAKISYSNETKVRCVEFYDKERESHEIRLRHLGEMGGRGIKKWDASQQARFEKQSGSGGTSAASQNLLAQSLLDFSLEKKWISRRKMQNIALTTLTRFLGTPEVRHVLGLADRTKLLFNLSLPDAENRIKRFLDDASKADSPIHSRTKAQDRKAYASQLESSIPLDGERIEAPYNPLSDEGEPKKNRTKGKPRDNRSPDHRNYLIPSDFSVKIRNKAAKRVYDNLKKLQIDDNEFAIACLFRTLLDAIVADFVGNNASLRKTRKQLLTAAARKLEAAGAKKSDFKSLDRAASNTHDILSPDTLGMYVHGGQVPTKKDLIRAWDNVEKAISAMLRS